MTAHKHIYACKNLYQFFYFNLILLFIIILF